MHGSESLGVFKTSYQWDNFLDLLHVSKTWGFLSSQMKFIDYSFKGIVFPSWKLICQWKIVDAFILCNVTLYLNSLIGIPSSVYILFSQLKFSSKDFKLVWGISQYYQTNKWFRNIKQTMDDRLFAQRRLLQRHLLPNLWWGCVDGKVDAAFKVLSFHSHKPFLRDFARNSLSFLPKPSKLQLLSALQVFCSLIWSAGLIQLIQRSLALSCIAYYMSHLLYQKE